MKMLSIQSRNKRRRGGSITLTRSTFTTTVTADGSGQVNTNNEDISLHVSQSSNNHRTLTHLGSDDSYLRLHSQDTETPLYQSRFHDRQFDLIINDTDSDKEESQPSEDHHQTPADSDEEESQTSDQRNLLSEKEIESTQYAECTNATLEATLELFSFCLDGGTSLTFFDNLITLLRGHAKNTNVNFSQLPSRPLLIQFLNSSFKCPTPTEVMVDRHSVQTFDILGQITDLLSSDLTDDISNLCVNPAPDTIFKPYVPADEDKYSEIQGSDWYMRTCDKSLLTPYLDSDGNNVPGFVLPLVIYMDKTGTDMYQRYPLEPVMFTLSIFRRAIREKEQSWRHLGFIPDLTSCTQKDDDGSNSCGANSTTKSVQLYHDCLRAILSRLVSLQKNPPVVTLDFGGNKQRCALILPVSIVTGDQLSQDKNCGRKAVASGAGRLHRSCMTSHYQVASCTAKSTRCTPVSKRVLERLSNIAQSDKEGSVDHQRLFATMDVSVDNATARNLLIRRAKIARVVLEDVLSTHPINNAWNEVDFGDNINGIHQATVDDFMHYHESGLGMYVGQVAYLGLTKTERNQIEELSKRLIGTTRSGIRDEYPRGHFHSGFSNMTLLTASEKIGLLFSLHLCLRTEQGYEVFETALKRQQLKYISFPITKTTVNEEDDSKHRKNKRSKPKQSDEGIDSPPSLEDYATVESKHQYRDRNKKHPFPRTEKTARLVTAQIKRHCLSFVLDLDLDKMQLDILLSEVWSIVRTSIEDTDDLMFKEFDDDGSSVSNTTPGEQRIDALIPTLLLTPLPTTRKVDEASKYHSTPTVKHDGEKLVAKHPFTELRQSDGWITKHRRIKPLTKGDGETSCVLSTVDDFQEFLEVCLAFHAFLHYSNQLPLSVRQDFVLIDHAFSSFVDLYRRTVYRGDKGIDDTTCKIHSHLHQPLLMKEYCDPQNSEAGKGERGLKVWAKLVSITALKRGPRTFVKQTSLRVQERQLLRRAAIAKSRRQKHLEDKPSTDEAEQGGAVGCLFKRKQPHFIYRLGPNGTGLETLYEVDRVGVLEPALTNPFPADLLTALERLEPSQSTFKIWLEAELQTEHDGRQYVRCIPCRPGESAYYDWAAVQFPQENNNIVPAKILLFYENKDGDAKAIVHSADYPTGKLKENGNFGIGRLASRWKLCWTANGWPRLYSISASDIQHLLYVVEEQANPNRRPIPPRCTTTAERNKYKIQALKSRSEWAAEFLKWAGERQSDRT